MGLLGLSVVVNKINNKANGATNQQSSVAQVYEAGANIGVDNLTEGSSIVNYYTKNKSLAPFVLQTAKLQSANKIFLQDLICEGPIFGLIDDLGNDLILFDNAENNNENLKGLYLNDYPVKNSRNNSYNYSKIEVYGKIGSEFQSSIPLDRQEGLFSYASPGVVYSYNKILYGLIKNTAGSPVSFQNTKVHNTFLCLAVDSKEIFIEPPDVRFTTTAGTTPPKFNTSIYNDLVFEECFGVYHEIRDPNADFLVITLKINTLYNIPNSDMENGTAQFGVQLGYKQNPDKNIYIYHSVNGIASSPYQFDLVLNIKDLDKNLTPYVKIFNFSTAPGVTETKVYNSIGVANITEIIDSKFKYPNSAYFITAIDARGFGGIPNRQYNLKLLQVKVPENYDADVKEYNGIWGGEFDPLLRWTDNPAWILYDIITNNRYGLGKFNFPESLADKWSIFNIGKYCDELVPTFRNSKFPALKILVIQVNNAYDYVELAVPAGTVITEDMFQKGQELHLFNLQFTEIDEDGQPSIVYKSFKKIIRTVTINVNNIYGGVVRLRLFNPFGLHKSCSRFSSVKKFVEEKKAKTSNEAVGILISELINDSPQQIVDFKNYILGQQVFSKEDAENYISSSGSAAQKFDAFPDLVEPRFTSNIYLKSETDVVNLINNISSIFKGIVYWSNNYVQFDNDSPKPSSYIFNNSNVKDGVFSYSGSSKDTRFTVVKVTYADASDGYKDKTVYVEDQINIKKYGYVEKELLGFGVTSKSQAKRTGEWFLVTNQVEQEIVNFQAGPECLLLSPGNVVTISDALKLTNRYGGRVIEVVNDEIVLDDKYDYIKVNDIISFIVPKKSSSIDQLNAEALAANQVTETQLNQLNSTYIYKYKVLSVGMDGSFRTKITLKTTNTSDDVAAEENVYTINPSTLWIYEQDSQHITTLYSKQYRIVGIKEVNPVEFDITAIEYVKTKFSYIDNRDNLAAKLLYSPEQDNQTIKIPKDILAGQTTKDVQGDDGIVLNTKSNFNFDDQYDFIFSGIDYSDDQIAGLFSVTTINVKAIFEIATSTYSEPLVKGLLIEYVLNSKKVSINWKLGDKSFFTIVTPNLEAETTFEFIRAYALGETDNFL